MFRHNNFVNWPLLHAFLMMPRQTGFKQFLPGFYIFLWWNEISKRVQEKLV